MAAAASSSSSPSSPRLSKRPRLSSPSSSSCSSSRPASSLHLSRRRPPPPLSLEPEESSTGSSTCCLSPSSSSTCTSAMRTQLDDTFSQYHDSEDQQENQHEKHQQRLQHETDITCLFLLDDTCDGGLGFDPDTVFHHDAALLPSDDDNDAAFAGCSAENGNWFLHDLDSEGNAFLDEVLDQEWMAAAVANLDRINETLDSDSCVLHLLESGAGS